VNRPEWTELSVAGVANLLAICLRGSWKSKFRACNTRSTE
jgi:hypothetical protein